ncbi:Uncharacterized protein FWK35_00018645 [Aphis craccivora]|uniref:Uncharacterized protein n=1 Tax=Aphis craccivora TaxID=307492 RepID=A0A6G0YWQ7_APHCR|nr:Uncharacterized protein FWK35_00018645 [Aphis craccivora]
MHWGGHFLNFPIVFKSAGKTQKKIKEKREFLRKTSFRPNRFFYIMVSVIYIHSNFNEISRKHKKLQEILKIKNTTLIQILTKILAKRKLMKKLKPILVLNIQIM